MDDELRKALDAFYAAQAEVQSTPEPGASLVGWKPIHSEALAVHPRRIAEATEDAKRKGVPTEFDKMGRPVFTSRRGRREYLKAYRCHDNHGGYGDG